MFLCILNHSATGLRHEARIIGGNDDGALFDAALKVPAANRVMDDLPPYILKGTLEEERWRQQHKKRETTGESTGAREFVDGVVTPATLPLEMET